VIRIHAYETLLSGVLLRRYKRFLVDIEFPGGRVATAFCPNSGSMEGCSEPGSPVFLSSCGERRERKTRHTLEMVKAGGTWIGVNTLLTNNLAYALLKRKLVKELSGYKVIRREVVYRDSRLDFFFPDGGGCFMEVKSVTLRNGRVAEFPDAVTVRGRRHLKALMQAKDEGYRACMLYIVQRSDCDCFGPATSIDPAYSDTLKAAMAKGVGVIVCSMEVEPDGIYFSKRLPFCG
jgi:sugar fermentation stimulation protein A